MQILSYFKKMIIILSFFEAYDRLKRKGVLGYRQITEHTAGDIHIICESTSHLSYPFLSMKLMAIFILCLSQTCLASFIGSNVYLFPNHWEKEKVLMHERLVDSTFFSHNQEQYCFSTTVDDELLFDRLDLFHCVNGEWVPCPRNPVKRDLSSARGAGKCFEQDGVWYRPSQDCSMDMAAPCV